jgi:hypothetical protein
VLLLSVVDLIKGSQHFISLYDLNSHIQRYENAFPEFTYPQVLELRKCDKYITFAEFTSQTHPEM